MSDAVVVILVLGEEMYSTVVYYTIALWHKENIRAERL